MTQEFTVERNRRREAFTITHRLRIRTAEAYVAAIERAGFQMQAIHTAYGTDTKQSEEYRMIFCARRPHETR
jgi:hypothetical protein